MSKTSMDSVSKKTPDSMSKNPMDITLLALALGYQTKWDVDKILEDSILHVRMLKKGGTELPRSMSERNQRPTLFVNLSTLG